MTSSDLPFFLPKIKLDGHMICCKAHREVALQDCEEEPFSWKTLAWAIQNHVDPKCIERYLESYDQSVVDIRLCATWSASEGGDAFPILFFAAERNSPEIVEMLCERGALVNDRAEISGLPLLAYTIMSAEYEFSDTTDTLVALLEMGADPNDIPRDMWCDYVASPQSDRPEDEDSQPEDYNAEWCTAEIRDALCRTLNLMQRCFLCKAGQTEQPTSRKARVAKAHNMGPLFKLPYRIIGQQLAIGHVEDAISSHFLYNTAQPLVLLFTGPSGHGKTKLAISLADLLSSPFLTVNCSTLNHSTDILGTYTMFDGWAQVSPLSAHLAQHAGQRNVIFLDALEKTTEDVRQLMLQLFERKYTDRLHNMSLDCSKCIWVLAANLGEPAIAKFWDDHL